MHGIISNPQPCINNMDILSTSCLLFLFFLLLFFIPLSSQSLSDIKISRSALECLFLKTPRENLVSGVYAACQVQITCQLIQTFVSTLSKGDKFYPDAAYYHVSYIHSYISIYSECLRPSNWIRLYSKNVSRNK